MKKHSEIYLLFLLCMIALSGYSQSHMMGIQLGVTEGYRNIKSNLNTSENNMNVAGTGFNAQLFYERMLSSHFSVQLSLGYVQTSFELQSMSGRINDLLWGSLVAPGYDRYVIRYYYNYAGLTTRVNYRTAFEKWNFIGGLGVCPEIAVGHSSTYHWYSNADRGSEERDFQDTPFNISVLASAGIQYRISEKFTARLEHICRYAMFPHDKFQPEYHIWSHGFNVSVGWVFGE